MDATSMNTLDTDTQLLGRLKRCLKQCAGIDGDEIQGNRKRALDYYFQRVRGDEVAGASQVVTGDISAMVEGNLALILNATTGKRVAEYCAYSKDDEVQAQLESDAVTDFIFRKQNGFIELAQAVKDCELARNAVMKIYIDRRTHKSRMRKSNVDPIALADVLDKFGESEIHSYDPNTGKLSATIIRKSRQFRAECLAPENFLYPKDWTSPDLTNVPFFFERHIDTRSTLIEKGVDPAKVKRLRKWNNPQDTGRAARMPRGATSFHQPIDSSQEYVEWFEAYVYMSDEYGASERHEIWFSDKEILLDEIAGPFCYAGGMIFINSHLFTGISLFDKLKWVQDVNTGLTRGVMDNANTTTKNRTAHLKGIVDTDDLSDGRTNGSIGVDPERVQDVRQAIMAFSVPDTTTSLLQNIEHMKRVRSELGGAALDMSTAQMQLNDRLGSQGLDRVYSAMEMLAQLMTQIFANTLVRNAYLIAHEVLRTQWDGPVPFKQGDVWVETWPSKWRPRDAVVINLGMSIGERMRMSAVYESILNKQAALAERGMENILVDLGNYYKALITWARINDVPIPEAYFTNPASPASQQTLRANQQQRAAAQQKQDSAIQQAISLEQLRVLLTKYNTDADIAFRYFDAVLDAEIEEAKITGVAVVDLLKAKAEARRVRNGNDGDTRRITSESQSASQRPNGQGRE